MRVSLLEPLFWVLLVFLVVAVTAESENLNLETKPESNEEILPRYVVFPGLDADLDEVAEWSFGYASPFNILFGPKPYVLGWVGEAPFGPVDEEEDIEDEEDIEGEDEEIDEDPEYDYEKA